jgi:hypothetical protein
VLLCPIGGDALPARVVDRLGKGQDARALHVVFAVKVGVELLRREVASRVDRERLHG